MDARDKRGHDGREAVRFNSSWPGLNAFVMAGLVPAIHVLLICMMSGGFVYIMTNRRDGTLYVGVTSDLVRRCYEHRNSLIRGFTKQYDLKQLVYFEQHDDIRSAIQRENDQALAACVEGAPGSRAESRLAGPV